MLYRSGRPGWRAFICSHSPEIGRRRDHDLRSKRAAVMPFIAMSLCLLMVTAGISIDLMRAFQTVHELEYGAQAAALYGLSLATNSDGSYSSLSAQSNIQNAISFAQSSSWNIAQAGPLGGSLNGPWSMPVSFSSVGFVQNPLDPNESFLQVTSQRSGLDALQEFFLPLAFAGFSSTSVPPQVQTVSPTSTVEVIGQPATRIGAGAPLNSPAGTRSFDLLGFATLPLAISNLQFSTIAAPSQVNVQYAIDLVASTQAEYKAAPPAGHIKGCLVNVAGTGTLGSYYGNGQGGAAIDQLEGLLGYFGAASGQNPITPAVVEAGSQLSGFDPFLLGARQSEVYTVLSQLPARFYIVPVLSSDPSFSSQNVVVGFARLQLQVNFVGGVLSITANIGDSVPVRNASSATGYSCIPGNANNLLPAPVVPFLPRQVDQASTGIAVRARGVVLAPAISPRQIALPIVPTHT